MPRVDRLLAHLSQKYGVPYVSVVDLKLPYLDDRLHLTPAGHREFGDAVAERIALLGRDTRWSRGRQGHRERAALAEA